MGFNQNVDEFGNVDFDRDDEEKDGYQDQKERFVHLHFQQRTSRKCLTLIQGLPEDLDFKKIVRQFKKAWCCNGTIVEHE